VKVWLVMLVERDTEGRFGGEILHVSRGTMAGFSGTPQMLALMEGMIPPQRFILEADELTGPGSAPGPAGG
jgi:hypothetical protein